MKLFNTNKMCFLLIVFLAIVSINCEAWEHHTLFTRQMIETVPEVTKAFPVEPESLQSFLLENEALIETVLAQEEKWARENLDWYAPCPDSLLFKATGEKDSVRKRFFRSIRINPNTRTPLYVTKIKTDPAAERRGLALEKVTLFPDAGELAQYEFIKIKSGNKILPVDVLSTASHEPDFGMDTGLFLDNGTRFGAAYGFGEQPFGDPDLSYGSQAPFHMGFYHESSIVVLFAGFLKQTYPEYRIHLYKALSEAAFSTGHDYWGWRFLGWGLHYLADLSMPYHTTVLPGYGTVHMLWINLLDMLGFPKQVDDALQLVSNRHMALERYQGVLMERYARNNQWDTSINEALTDVVAMPVYRDTTPRKEIASASHDQSEKVNELLLKYMPESFVNDPRVELGKMHNLDEIVESVQMRHGSDAIQEMNASLAEAFRVFSMYGRSYISAVRH